MGLTDEVNIVLHGDQEEAALPKLKEALAENGYAYSEGEYDASKSNIIISSSREHCAECMETESEALDHVEGYVLTSSDDENANGDVTIVGSDVDGAYSVSYTHLDRVAASFQKTSQGSSGDAFPETGNYTACNKYIFYCHFFSSCSCCLLKVP